MGERSEPFLTDSQLSRGSALQRNSVKCIIALILECPQCIRSYAPFHIPEEYMQRDQGLYIVHGRIRILSLLVLDGRGIKWILIGSPYVRSMPGTNPESSLAPSLNVLGIDPKRAVLVDECEFD